MRFSNLFVILAIFLVFGCVSQSPNPPILNQSNDTDLTPVDFTRLSDSNVTSKDIEDASTANNRFAIKLYSKLKEKEGNLFFSPYSVSSAFGMLYEGANGQTEDELRSLFEFPSDDNSRRNGASYLYNLFNNPNKSYILRTANAIWVQKDYKLLDKYLSNVENFYGGKATNVDFIANTESTRKLINKWVEERTNNKIMNLFPEGSLSSATRLAITNAVYFKGKWAEQFDPKDTKDEDFHIGLLNTVRVPTMYNKDSFRYIENNDLQLLEMPYEGVNLSMFIILPKSDLGALENSLSIEKIQELQSQASWQEVNVYLPKFKLETDYQLNEHLIDLGIPSAFSSDADFSGIDGTRSLVVSTVVHKAFVEVNEEGTEAAAATGISMDLTSAPPETLPIIFRADHPFIFMIEDKETDTILFMGRIVDPTK